MGGQTQGQDHEDKKSDEGEFEVPFPKEIQNREKNPGIGGENEHGDAQGHGPERPSLRIPPPEEIVEEIEEILFLEEHSLFLGDGQVPEFQIEKKNSGGDEDQADHHSGGEQATDGQLKFRFARISIRKAQRELTPLYAI